MTDTYQVVLSYADGRGDDILVLASDPGWVEEWGDPFTQFADAVPYYADPAELVAVSITKVGAWS